MGHGEDRYQDRRYSYQNAKDLYQAFSTHVLLLPERFRPKKLVL